MSWRREDKGLGGIVWEVLSRVIVPGVLSRKVLSGVLSGGKVLDSKRTDKESDREVYMESFFKPTS